MENKHPIDELFAKGLTDYEASPKGDAWPGIRAVAEQRAKRKRFILWRWAAVVAALLLAFYSGYYFNDHSTPTSPSAPPGQAGPAELNRNTDNTPDYSRRASDTKDVEATPVAGKPAKTNESQEEIGDITTISANFKKNSDGAEGTPIQNNSPSGAISTRTRSSTYNDTAKVILPLKSFGLVYSNQTQGGLIDNTLIPKDGYVSQFPHSFNPAYLPESVDRERVFPPISVRLLAGINFPFSESTFNTDDQQVRDNLAKASPERTYAGGVKFGIRLSKSLEMRGGLIFNQWRQTTTDIKLLVSPTSVGTSTNVNLQAKGYTSSGNLNFEGFADPSNQGQFETAGVGGSPNLNYALLPELTEEYRFIDVPLSLAWYLIEKPRWNMSARGGLNSRFITHTKATLTYANGKEESYDEIHLHTFSMQLMAGAGINYSLTRRLQIGLQPTLLYGISAVNMHQQVDTYFHQILIFSSLTYRF